MIERKDIEYSVIVPVFNSELSLIELFTRIKSTFDQIEKTFEVIFIDDSSRDKSWEVVVSLKNKFPYYITAIQLAKNFGQHNAIFCGLQFFSGKFVITLDDDLQIPPEEIIKLIQRYNETRADLVYGDLVNKDHGFIRNQGSKIMKDSAKKRDNDATGKGSSFKMFTADMANKLKVHHQNFIYIDELLMWYTKDIVFAEVNHEPRKYQESNYSIYKLFKLFINITIYYTVVPLKFMTYGGLFMSIITFVIGMVFIFKKMFFNVPLGFTSIIVTILFTSSIILLSLGVIGEYLNRIFQVQNKKPPYSIKRIM